MPKNALKAALREAEEANASKDKKVLLLEERLRELQQRVAELEDDNHASAHLDQDVDALLSQQRDTISSHHEYESRVLELELQGMADRWRVMDIEELCAQNHELREEAMKLHDENMELSRLVADNSLRSRRDLSRVQLGMEMAVRARLREARAELRQELHAQLDKGTRRIVEEHGALQGQVLSLARQAAALDSQWRHLSAQRQQYKVDADVAAGMGAVQARQVVSLRQQLERALTAVAVLQSKLDESEAAGQQAVEQAFRAGRSSALRDGGRPKGDQAASGHEGMGDEDSAYGMEGDDGGQLRRQLQHSQGRCEQLRLQRDKWRDRANLYEVACARLQASLQTVLEQRKMARPDGSRQQISAIWSSNDGGSVPASPSGASGQKQQQQRQLQDRGRETESPEGVYSPMGAALRPPSLHSGGTSAMSLHGGPVPQPPSGGGRLVARSHVEQRHVQQQQQEEGEDALRGAMSHVSLDAPQLGSPIEPSSPCTAIAPSGAATWPLSRLYSDAPEPMLAVQVLPAPGTQPAAATCLASPPGDGAAVAAASPEAVQLRKTRPQSAIVQRRSGAVRYGAAVPLLACQGSATLAFRSARPGLESAAAAASDEWPAWHSTARRHDELGRVAQHVAALQEQHTAAPQHGTNIYHGDRAVTVSRSADAWMWQQGHEEEHRERCGPMGGHAEPGVSRPVSASSSSAAPAAAPRKARPRTAVARMGAPDVMFKGTRGPPCSETSAGAPAWARGGALVGALRPASLQGR